MIHHIKFRRVAIALLLLASVGAIGIAAGWRRPARPGPAARPIRMFAYGAFSERDVEMDRYRAALEKCRPSASWHAMPALLHGLMLWGPQPNDPTGPTLLACVLDHRSLVEAYGDHTPFLVRTRYGAQFSDSRVTAKSRADRESHVGQALSILAELEVPPSRRIETADGPATMKDVIDDLVANYSPDAEPEWTVAALACYLPPERSWRNKFGEEYSFDEVASRLLERPHGLASPCAGTHTLYSLSVLLQVDRQASILSRDSRARAEAYLRRAASLLEKSQRGDGSWGIDWAREVDPARLWKRQEPIWMTGHHLDWMAIVPDVLRVPPDRLASAARFVARSIAAIPDETVPERDTCAYYHGPRAIRRLLGGPTLGSP